MVNDKIRGLFHMLENTEKRYLPQDEICQRCGGRIGSHTDYNLWKCLEILSKKVKRMGDVLRE